MPYLDFPLKQDASPGFSRRSQELIAAAFLSFAVLVVAWFIAPSHAEAE